MNALTMVRHAVKTVSVMGVQQVIDNVVVATIPEVATTGKRIMARIGGAVLSAYIGDAIGSYINQELDDIFSKIAKATSSDEKETDGEPVVTAD